MTYNKYKKMKTLFKKEISYYLNNPVGYIVIILFAVFVNFWAAKDIFVSSIASIKPFFSLLPWFLMVFIPALAMRIFSEEKRVNTIEVLLTLPVKETEIFLAKFLALMNLVGLGMILTLGLPLFLAIYSRLFLPEILVSYFGVLLLSSVFVSLAIFLSNKTKNQVVAFLLAVIINFILMVLTTDFLASILPKFLIDLFNFYSPMIHYQNFIKGIVDIRSIFYFISFFSIFFLLTVIDLKKRQ